MTVRELILELAKHDLDKEVAIHNYKGYNEGEYELGDVYETENYVFITSNLFVKKGDYFND